MIANSVLVTNGKGGVGKTSLVANVAGLAAASGWRTLAIDIDPQGNLARDLGVLEAADDGSALRDAILGRTPLAPITSIRPRLDLAVGGPALDGLTSEIHTIMAKGQYLTALSLLEAALTRVAGDYDLIIIDSPPGERALQTLAARAAHHLVIPTAPDDCSIDGLDAVFGRFNHLRVEGGNPDLRILGVALTLTLSHATAVQRRVRQTLSDLLGDRVNVFHTTIRFAQAAAVGCRRDGQLAHEYEQAALTATPWYDAKEPVVTYSRAASGLAGDYQRLTNEILTSFTTDELKRTA